MAGFISFDYMCTNEECEKFNQKEERLHRRNKEQFCESCEKPVEKQVSFPGGAQGTHISWSLWRAV